MKKLLIVSPHFPPINAPDHQRVRMALPYFQEYGWDARVLAVAPEFVSGVLERDLELTVPRSISVTRTQALPEGLTRFLGLGNLGWRALFHLQREGAKLLQRERYDLIYFSTTMFRVLSLGPQWKSRFSTPFVIDYQDPWRSDYYSREGISTPLPGGKLKHAFSQLTARVLEPQVMKHTSGVTCVSSNYPMMLRSRYPQLDAESLSVIPFAASEKDFELLERGHIEQEIFNPEDGNEHWVYLGRASEDMHFALRAFFSVLKQLRVANPHSLERIRMHFIGTSYAPPSLAKKTVEPLAKEFGLSELVSEYPLRIPFFQGLCCLRQADRLLLIGSDDKDYSPSKVFPYLLARKPMFALLHQESLAAKILERYSSASCKWYEGAEPSAEFLTQLRLQLETFMNLSEAELSPEFYEKHSARAMTGQLCQFFEKVLERGPSEFSDPV